MSQQERNKSTAPATPVARPGIDWRAVWPVPALALAVIALVGGIVIGVLRAPRADPAGPLSRVVALMEGGKYEEAIDTLNSVVPAINAGRLSTEQRREYHLQRARAFYLGQQKIGVERIENFREVAANFKQAEKLGGALEPADVGLYAEALLASGEPGRAIDLANSLGAKEGARRAALVRTIVEYNLRQRDVQYDLTLSLLSDYAQTAGLSLDERAWATARQTDLRLAMGFHEEAINALLRAMPKLEGMSAPRRGDLLYRLGRAYYLSGQMAPAAKQLESSIALLPAGEAARGDALTLGAAIKQANGKIEEARDQFAQVRMDYKEAACLAPALLGLAECLAAGGDDDASVETYGELVTLLSEGSKQREVTGQRVAASLMERHTDRFVRGEFRAALRFATLADRAYRAGGEPPPAVLQALGASNRKVAEQILSDARNTDQGVLSIDQVSPVTAAEAKKYLLDAGGAYREHARAVVVSDNVAYGESLWMAGDCFDQGGDREAAKEAFGAYVDGATDDDPRRPEAKFRLAQVLQTQRQWTGAIALYRELVEGKGKGQSAAPSGIWADRSLVPLARCLLSDDTAENDGDAEKMLEAVVEGSTLAPDSLEYRDAVTELGELCYRTRRYAEAITRLSEAAQRHPDGPRATIVLFKLADANRMSAALIAADLMEPRPPSERQQLESARVERLRTAMGLFEQVQQRLLAKDKRKSTDLDRLMLRNSAFTLADCAYDLGDFAGAIRLYDAAAQRHSTDPASLVAMVQIVNAYVAQGKWAEAATAHDRAQRQLASLPESVWNSPDIPMERKHWERWLDSSSLLEQRRRARAGVE